MKSTSQNIEKYFHHNVAEALERLGYSLPSEHKLYTGVKVTEVRRHFKDEVFQTVSFGAASSANKKRPFMQLIFALEVPRLRSFLLSLVPPGTRIGIEPQTERSIRFEFHAGNQKENEPPSFENSGDVTLFEPFVYKPWDVQKCVEGLDAQFTQMIRRVPIYFWSLRGFADSFAFTAPLMLELFITDWFDAVKNESTLQNIQQARRNGRLREERAYLDSLLDP